MAGWARFDGGGNQIVSAALRTERKSTRDPSLASLGSDRHFASRKNRADSSGGVGLM
jgi:hypothetical protein